MIIGTVLKYKNNKKYPVLEIPYTKKANRNKGEVEYYIFPLLLQTIQDLSSLIDYMIQLSLSKVESYKVKGLEEILEYCET